MTATIATEIVLEVNDDKKEEENKSIFYDGECIMFGGIDITDCHKSIHLSLFEHNNQENNERMKEYNLYKINTLIETLQKFKTDYLELFEKFNNYLVKDND